LCQYDTTLHLPTGLVDAGAPCRLYDDMSAKTHYYGFDCPDFPFSVPDGYPGADYSKCTSTNIGGGLMLAGNALGGQYPTGSGFSSVVRLDSLWVTILLTDGSANAGQDSNGNFICPESPVDRRGNHPPYCVDTDATAATRHDKTNPAYDADDYAHDMVDFVANSQHSLIFTIGLGNQVTNNFFQTDPGKLAPGETLLKYAANTGLGVYYFSPGGSQLNAVFLAIANKIATRLTK
jgi:hypothetical protein